MRFGRPSWTSLAPDQSQPIYKINSSNKFDALIEWSRIYWALFFSPVGRPKDRPRHSKPDFLQVWDGFFMTFGWFPMLLWRSLNNLSDRFCQSFACNHHASTAAVCQISRFLPISLLLNVLPSMAKYPRVRRWHPAKTDSEFSTLSKIGPRGQQNQSNGGPGSIVHGVWWFVGDIFNWLSELLPKHWEFTKPCFPLEKQHFLRFWPP